MTRPRILCALSATLVLLASACGHPPESKADQAARLLAPATVETDEGLRIDGELIADAELYEAALDSHVVLYSATGKEAEDLTVARFEEETGIRVRLTRLPNNKLAERVLSEHGAGQLGADAIRLTDPPTAQEFADAGVYAPHETVFDEILEEQGAPRSEGYFTGYYFVNVLAYNSAMITEDPPADWQALVDPRYEGRTGMVSISTGGTLKALTRFQIETYGTDFLRAQAEQGPRVFNSTSTQVDALARGEIAVGPVSFNNAFAAELAGAPITLVVPEDGVSASQGPLGLTPKGTRNPAAEVFANWSLSKSGQRFAAAQGFVPVRTDIGTVPSGDYQLPLSDSPRFHLLTEEGFAEHARKDEQLWQEIFDVLI
jgi:iron(III) transport system substrate-binding protein